MMTVRRPVTIVGAGVVGFVTALRLADEGWAVTVLSAGAASASGAAAGMLAPAAETLLEGGDRTSADTALRARALWNGLARRLRIELNSSGSLLTGQSETGATPSLTEARSLGFQAALVPWRASAALHLADDAVLDPRAALDALDAELARLGVGRRCERVSASAEGLRTAAAPLLGEVVVAAGWGAAGLAPAAPELAALTPIKGQLLRLASPSGAGPALRADDAYLAPQPWGWIAGATMEAGRDDLTPDPAALARLQAAAVRLRPDLAQAPAEPAVGVRAATPDGAPLVGRSRTGVWLATGMRRNGWLWAPLVAEGIAAYLGGRDPDAALAGQARAWDPRRFEPFRSERAPA